jgi:hypothetical protein
MDLWMMVLCWAAAVAALYGFSTYLEEHAAMRGTHRKPLPAWVDKCIRLFFLFALLSPLLLLLSWKLLLPAVALYIPTYLDNAEKTGARNSEWFKASGVFRYVQRYFSLKVVNSNGGKKLDAKKKYIIGVHPHGLLPVGSLIACLTNVAKAKEIVMGDLPVSLIVASFCFYVPGYRDFLVACGVLDAARYNARAAIDKGRSLVLIPGGATEGLYAKPGKHTVVLNRRKGFIKLALETGCDLVPAYGFGENNCYDQLSTKLPWVKGVQAKFQNILGISLPLVAHLLPRRSPITLVFGVPIAVAKVAKPSAEEIDALHAKYVAALTKVFNDHAADCIPNPDERKLEVI